METRIMEKPPEEFIRNEQFETNNPGKAMWRRSPGGGGGSGGMVAHDLVNGCQATA